MSVALDFIYSRMTGLEVDLDRCWTALLPEAIDSRDEELIGRALGHAGEDIIGVGRDAHQIAGVGDIRTYSLRESEDSILEGRCRLIGLSVVVPEEHVPVFVRIL